ncbi:MAG: (d)CMP kinase [Gemmatimonadota bacterium]
MSAQPGVRIAIDGPAGSGKSSTAVRVARRLGFAYVDSGALYRAATLLASREASAGRVLDGGALARRLERTRVEQRLEPETNRTLLDGEDVTERLREAEVARAVGRVAAQPEVRRVVTTKLREMASRAPTVMDGRDIGTVVAPEAPLKVFLDASVQERARRRSAADRRTVDAEALARRDAQDRGRATAPLAPAADAVVLLTDDLTLEQQVERILELHHARTV